MRLNESLLIRCNVDELGDQLPYLFNGCNTRGNRFSLFIDKAVLGKIFVNEYTQRFSR